jgi:uncharacterized protein (TIGR02421 family)
MLDYRKSLRELSDKLVEAQKPIRILDAIKWDESISGHLKKTNFKSLPDLGPAFYTRNVQSFEPEAKRNELFALDTEVMQRLGAADPLGSILRRNIQQYILVTRMLENRGTPDFYRYSKELFGSSLDSFLDGHTPVYVFGEMMCEIFTSLDDTLLGTLFECNIPAEEAVKELGLRLKAYFPDQPVRVILSDGILADAAAGADYVKLRRGGMFSARDIDILEVHEGWVHLGTSLNGQKQPYATWLAKGPPCASVIQEGLAVTLEMFSFVTYPTRARKFINRLRACHMAEEGANLIDVYEFFRSENASENEALYYTERIFRGGNGQGTPFTKDVSYAKGFILIYNFMRTALRAGKVEYLPCLFTGKMALEDVPVIHQAILDGHVVPAHYVPQPFKDLNALATWMSFSNFFNKIHLENVYDYYAPLFNRKT